MTVQPHRRLAPGELLLEQITSNQLLSIRGRSQQLREYHSQMFFELEAQRSAQKDKILAALQSVAGTCIDINGWCRAIRARYCHSPLSCVGSMKCSGRFNFGKDVDEQRFPVFPALYIASDRTTAHCEMFSITHAAQNSGLSDEDLALHRDTSIGYFALKGEVHNIFDLTLPESLSEFLKVTKKFQFTADLRKKERQLGLKPSFIATTRDVLMRSFMDRSWRGFLNHVDLPANGQVFGQLVSAAGFEGIRYKSVRTNADNLVIFPRNFQNSFSFVGISDIPQHTLTADNFKEAECC